MSQTFVLGMNAKIYQGAAGADLATVTEMSNVKDVTLTLEAGEADVTTRGNQGWRATAPTLRECTVEFEMLYKPGEAGFEAIKTAFLSNGSICLAVLTGAVLTLVSAARGEQDTSLIEFALVLLYAATLAQVGYLTVRPAVATGQAGLAWFQLNTFLVVGALSVAAGNGAYRLVRQACSATPSPMASEPTEVNATD